MYLRLRAAAVLIFSVAAVAGTPGSFRGVLYKGADTKPGWWYVVGKNDSLRLVYTAEASVTYGEQVPQEDRKPQPKRSLAPGADVRVTAEQDSKGAWRATEVEILSLRGVGTRASGTPARH